MTEPTQCAEVAPVIMSSAKRAQLPQGPAPGSAMRPQPSSKTTRKVSAAPLAPAAAKHPKLGAGAAEVQKFPQERETMLFDWLTSDTCGEKGQGEVVDFLQSLGVQLPQDADGEVELDPESLDTPTLWKLDRFCQQQSKGEYAPDAQSTQPRGPVLAMSQYEEDDETDED
jgi:hypothetical protein